MTAIRGQNSPYIHSITIVLGTPFPASDGILVRVSGNPTITLKTGGTVVLTAVAANSVLPLAATNITGTGEYSALYQ
jgi:hypothetical protein